MAAERFNECAGLYQDKYMDVGPYQDGFDQFCDRINKPDAELLEIGCGPGNITRYLLDKCPGFNILGVDLAPSMVAFAAQNNPTARFQVMDCRDLGTQVGNYDGVMCGFCLPYLSKDEALQLIQNVSKLLRDDGVFYLSTMEGDYANSGFVDSSSGSKESIYIHYHQADYLTEGLRQNGFTDIGIQRQESPPQAGPTTNDLLLLATR